MKFNSAVSKFLTSKLVLNIVSILALFNVIGYAVTGNLNAVLYFIIFAVLVRYFSKNMTIVLGVPLLIVNLMALRSRMTEGMENNKNADVKKNDQDKINALVKKNNNKQDAKTSQGLVMTSVQDNQPAETETDANGTTEQQGFEPGRRKNKGHEIDYAATVEDAYDQLNSILGSDGIKNLTEDTQNLMKQQMQLAEAMKGMGPLVESIKPMVEQLQGMMNDKGMGNIMDLAKNMTNKK